MALSSIKDAIPCIEEAIILAALEGYFRIFLDEGSNVAALLRKVRHLSPVFVDGLLKAFDGCKPDNTLFGGIPKTELIIENNSAVGWPTAQSTGPM